METPLPINLSLAMLRASPTNPRKKFNPTKQAELTANMRIHGVLQALLVRPRWCVGVETRAEIERLQGRGDLVSTPFELVAGERRFRSANEAELGSVPCTVRFFTDAEAYDIQLIENLQRDDLTPIEEADGYRAALELRIDGKPVHTVSSLAARINKDEDHIYDRLKLVDLPKSLRDAVEQGHLPVSHATRVARVPDPVLREEAGLKVLNGHGKNSPLSYVETTDLLSREYMRELKGAPFDQEDPTLCALTVAGRPDFERWSGKCSDCPYRSGNITGFEGKRVDICTNPECFTLKATAAYDRIVREAEAAGKIVLRTGDAARHFDPLGDLVFTTTLVRAGAKPREDQLKPEVKRAPTWGALAEVAREKGLDVPVYVTRNPKTHVVEELLDSAPLIAAAKKIGEPIFRGGKEDEPLFTSKRPGEDEDDRFRREQSELSKQRREEAKTEAAQRLKAEAHGVLAFKGVYEALAADFRKASGFISWPFDAFQSAFTAAARTGGLRYVAKLFALKVEDGEFGLVDAVTTWLNSLPIPDRCAASLMLLVSAEVAAEGAGAQDLRRVAAVFNLDLDKIVTAKPVRQAQGGPKPKNQKKTRLAKAAKGAKSKPAKKTGKKRGGK